LIGFETIGEREIEQFSDWAIFRQFFFSIGFWFDQNTLEITWIYIEFPTKIVLNIDFYDRILTIEKFDDPENPKGTRKRMRKSWGSWKSRYLVCFVSTLDKGEIEGFREIFSRFFPHRLFLWQNRRHRYALMSPFGSCTPRHRFSFRFSRKIPLAQITSAFVFSPRKTSLLRRTCGTFAGEFRAADKTSHCEYGFPFDDSHRTVTRTGVTFRRYTIRASGTLTAIPADGFFTPPARCGSKTRRGCAIPNTRKR